MSGLRLTYFDIKGRGELPRLILAAAGQKFEDDRISFEEWGLRKAGAKFHCLPNLLMNGKVYGQTLAIAQFLAREYGLYGKGNVEALQVDEVVQSLIDIKADILNNFFVEDQEKKASNERGFQERIPKLLDILENITVKNQPGYFVGSKLTLADIAFFDAWEFMKAHVPNGESENAYPELKKILVRVASVPSVKTYLANRKETPF